MVVTSKSASTGLLRRLGGIVRDQIAEVTGRDRHAVFAPERVGPRRPVAHRDAMGAAPRVLHQPSHGRR